MTAGSRKPSALLEVLLVRFVLITFVIWASVRATGLSAWEMRALSYPFVTNALLAAIPLLLLILTRRDLAAYGLTLANARYHLGVAATCFVPFALSSMPTGMGADYRTWPGALIMSAVELALLFVVAWLLRKRPSLGAAGSGAALCLALPLLLAQAPALGRAAAALLFYAVFLGPGEEVLYRGYIQSRLNEAFGRPYETLGVRWGWGLPLTALIFGLSHTALLNPQHWGAGLVLPWGVWTFFGGLVLGYLREKTGSVAAGALLHGLPQALYEAAMALM